MRTTTKAPTAGTNAVTLTSSTTGTTTRPPLPPAKVQAYAVQPFTVSETWLEITVTIEAKTAEFLAARSELVRGNYGRDVSGYAIQAESIIQAGKEGKYSPAQVSAMLWRLIGDPSLSHGSLQGRKTAEIKIVMKSYQWETVEAVAAYHKCSPAPIIRAALAQRRRGIIDFENPAWRAKQAQEQAELVARLTATT